MAATESPPPTTTLAPSPVRSARNRAMARVPSPNVRTEDAEGPVPEHRPRGRERFLDRRRCSAVRCPRPTTSSGSCGREPSCARRPVVTSLATTTSLGSRKATPFDSAVSRMRLASSTRSFSSRPWPRCGPGHEERVGHAAADHECVDAVHQVFQDLDLPGDLRAADDRGERALRRLQEEREVLDLLLHQEPCVGGSSVATPYVDACARCAEPNASFM